MPPAIHHELSMFDRVRCSLAVPPLTLLVFLIAFVQRDYAQSPHAVNTGYVGSQECALCHADIFETYSKTDMGRSMAVAQTTLAHLPRQASVFEPRLNRQFNLSSGPSDSTQSEYQLAPDGRELFRETKKIGWILGAGTNCIKSIVRRGEYLFEAPLSFYSNTNSWALSPGYEKADYGFSRPLGADCVAVTAADRRQS